MGLVSVDIVLDELSITDASPELEAKIQRYIDAVSARIEKITGPLEAADYSEKYSGSGNTNLVLSHYPIIEVTTVKVDDSEIDNYEILKASAGILYKEDIWERRAYIEPLNMSPKGSSNQALLNIDIDYSAGYETIPQDIQDIAVQEVIRKYDQTWRKGEVKSWSLGEASKSFSNEPVDQESGLLAKNAAYLYKYYVDMVII